jgi:hypothetical protein
MDNAVLNVTIDLPPCHEFVFSLAERFIIKHSKNRLFILVRSMNQPRGPTGIGSPLRHRQARGDARDMAALSFGK